jgi:hypothetical protein
MLVIYLFAAALGVLTVAAFVLLCLLLRPGAPPSEGDNDRL